MSRKFWRVSSFDKKQAAQLAYEYGYDEFAVLLLNSRGITDPEDIADFLDDNGELSDPYLMKDVDKAVNRIRKAIDNYEKIAVYGDYDADGVTATALLYLYLEAIGAYVTYYIPSRMDEGYGLHNEAVDSLAQQGVRLIITVDNGINSVKEAEYIKSKGIDLIVTDHHQPGDVLPDAVAVVNPHRADDTSPFKEFAGVGVAFKLAVALEDGDFDSVLADFADIVTIGTIADIVPLKGENRTLAVRGIQAINDSSRVGISALREVTGYKDKDFSSTGIAFAIAPRINAAGRVDSASTALRLLLAEDEFDAQMLAKQLDGYNVMRQDTEAGIVEEAIRKIEADDEIKYSKVIVVDCENWHSGVIGIVASKLVERYGKPAIVIAKDGSGEAKGSCRSIDGYSLFDALTYAKDSLVRFGGHTLAAGFSVNDDKIDDLRKKLNEYAEKSEMFYPVLHIDCKLNPATINMGLIETISALEPFGAENPQPLFGLYKVTIKGIKPLGATGKHIRLSLEKKFTQFSAVYFGVSADSFPYEIGDVVDLAVTVDKNEFRGEVKPNIYIRAVKDSAFTDEDYFASELLYNKIRRGDSLTEAERQSACPDRAFAAMVFRFVKNKNACNRTAEQIAVKLGFGSSMTCRVQITLDAFCELNLMKYENGCYSVIENAAKTSLGESVLLSRLGYTG